MSFQGFVADKLSGASPFMQALVADGIVGGVGAVVGFLPLVMVMYFLMALLEDCGYMARVSMVLDPIFKRLVCPVNPSFPRYRYRLCNPRCYGGAYHQKRKRTQSNSNADILHALWCKAARNRAVRGAFFADASWVGTLMYFVGIILIFCRRTAD